ncbi:WD repeat and HMG-box DNA-binding protein 1 [Wickerhamomyces ciferrii]|uniref:WD repeat and HMG-box DNA-binding protein 1 n=1 Tax=Wickerhamomyces ciferrii (strain ATCC 14091 / BCRC 22168 / CBS 111 / JCM 3599 / NBRC 0793 / NRRL Y-1031 F-60-10) TaxID=1206466 RepID=K0KMH3_WICCF|nr:WD repeat and HMG-box DNA-binding protein 1 [Wickerhamomyces ciferrii]CCH42293.1 WD repeat and HMG-box DNA-binding protein 1 [Wickerhamomyces ciferrii]
MVDPEVRNVYSSGGITYVAYTANGKNLIVAGSNGLIRNYKVGDDESEPSTWDILDEITDLQVCGNDKAAVSSKIGEVETYSLDENKTVGKVIRSSLPVRGIVFTHKGSMIAAAGDDVEVQIADLSNSSRVIKLKTPDQVHDVSYNPNIDAIALSLSNGEIQIYSLTSEEPKFIATIKEEIPKLIYQDNDDDDEEEEAEDNIITARLEWNPDGDHFAVPSSTKEIKVFSRSSDFKESYSFPRSHTKNLSDLKWSPGGEFLASGDIGNHLIIWDAETREPVLEEKLENKINNLSWGKNESDNSYNLAVGSDNGDIFIFQSVIKVKSTQNTKKTLRPPSSAIADIEAELDLSDNESENEEEGADDINSQTALTDNEEENDDRNGIQGRDFDDDGFIDDDGFVVDDDGNGYIIPTARKPDYEDRQSVEPQRKRSKPSSFIGAKKYRIKPYSQGCTPYISDRRYLTINSIGYVSTVKQDSHSSITVSFFDASIHREYHFDDLYGYDLASLHPDGILLGNSGSDSNSSRILFRPHENANDSWEKLIPTSKGEIITSVSLSESIIIVCTSFGYIRSYSLFGLSVGLQKSAPILASAVNTNYMFTISLANNNQLIYNLQNLDGQYLQRDLTLPLDLQNDSDLLKGIFFNSYGDPVITGNDGVVLLLAKWRTPLQATWIPIMDSNETIKEAGGVGDLNVWPLGLHGDNLNCILVRGTQYPTYPLPLPSELEIKLPIHATRVSDDDNAENKAEELFLRSRTMGELLGETLTNDGEIYEDDNQRLTDYAISHDRAVLQLFGFACQEGKNGKAFRLSKEIKQDHGLAACNKIAERMGLVSLAKRITQLREQRMAAEEEL